MGRAEKDRASDPKTVPSGLPDTGHVATADRDTRARHPRRAYDQRRRDHLDAQPRGPPLCPPPRSPRGPRTANRGAAVAAVLPAVACLVSVVSGFFDGGLRNDELGTGLFAFQVGLLAVTTAVGVFAAVRAAVVLRMRNRTPRRR